MIFTYLHVPLRRMTFSVPAIYDWVVGHCVGYTLNLFAGETVLAGVNEVRNDIRAQLSCSHRLDALDFVRAWQGRRFDTVVLDPPYAYRKSMEMYDGAMNSRFKEVKDGLLRITTPDARVITFGYHSVSMGQQRGFHQEEILLMSHGGAIHDTIATVERREQNLITEGVRS